MILLPLYDNLVALSEPPFYGINSVLVGRVGEVIVPGLRPINGVGLWRDELRDGTSAHTCRYGHTIKTVNKLVGECGGIFGRIERLRKRNNIAP